MRQRRDAVVSTQVLLEWYSVVTRKFTPPMPPDVAVQAMASLAELDVIPADSELVVRAAKTSSTHQVSMWDPMIIETPAWPAAKASSLKT